MFELFKGKLKIDYASKFKPAIILSALLVLGSLYLSFFGKGLRYGVDFRGGAEIQVKFNTKVGTSDVRDALTQGGFNAVVQTIGEPEQNEFLLKVQTDESNLNKVTDSISQMLTQKFNQEGPEIRKTDIVGPKAGAQLRMSGFQAMLWALLAIMIYIGLRFDFKYAPGAIVATFHDVVIVLGFFALTDREFTLQIVGALLALIGYSVNDTVIVYDRVREHEAKYSGLPLTTHINNAINETMSRTILTSGTTLFICLSMVFFGGESIHDFFVVMTLGIIVGTYSSVFIAAPVTLFLDKLKKRDGAKAVKASSVSS